MPLPEALSSRTQDRSYWERLSWFCLISLKVVVGLGWLAGQTGLVRVELVALLPPGSESDCTGLGGTGRTLASGVVTCEETMRSGQGKLAPYLN